MLAPKSGLVGSSRVDTVAAVSMPTLVLGGVNISDYSVGLATSSSTNIQTLASHSLRGVLTHEGRFSGVFGGQLADRQAGSCRLHHRCNEQGYHLPSADGATGRLTAIRDEKGTSQSSEWSDRRVPPRFAEDACGAASARPSDWSGRVGDHAFRQRKAWRSHAPSARYTRSRVVGGRRRR